MAPPDKASLDRLVDLAFDHACTRPLSDYVSIDRALDALALTATPDRLAALHTRWGVPFRERVLRQAKDSTVTLSQWLPDDVAQALTEAMGEPLPLPRKLVDDTVATDRVRESVRAMLQETLGSFVARATAAASDTGEPSGRGGLRGALGWGARAVVASGKGLMAGLGEELQRTLQDRARDFVDTAVSSVQARIVERLTSDDTARALGRARRQWFERTLARTEASVTESLRRAPVARFDAMMPAVVAYNIARGDLRAVVHGHLTAVVTTLSQQSLGELLDVLGLRESARASAHAVGLPWLEVFASTEGFGAWWRALEARAGVDP